MLSDAEIHPLLPIDRKEINALQAFKLFPFQIMIISIPKLKLYGFLCEKCHCFSGFCLYRMGRMHRAYIAGKNAAFDLEKHSKLIISFQT